MRLHLVRHGHTDALGRTLTGRAPGIGLNAEGRHCAEEMARRLSSQPIAGVFSSPSLRARQTAEQIARATGCAVEDEPALDEIDFGAWTGRDFAELSQAPGWAEWNSARALATTPGGETMLQVQARALAFLLHLPTRHADGDLVLVSHGDVIKSVLACLLGMSLDLMHRIEIAPASRSVVVLRGTDARVEAVNLPPGA